MGLNISRLLRAKTARLCYLLALVPGMIEERAETFVSTFKRLCL